MKKKLVDPTRLLLVILGWVRPLLIEPIGSSSVVFLLHLYSKATRRRPSSLNCSVQLF
ncbi:hypothetical protein Csa_014028 [Cucumis sativus]|uniref:Uncharacterized protein n=1 Tax=Cucumis sativus TaxID=3659 RepID=A0A0A0LSG0_CUCSA|nr:hypothetical protein Csa_014028 [Cucumis sativus]